MSAVLLWLLLSSTASANSALEKLKLDGCKVDAECMLVRHRHCCGSTKTAINRKHKRYYDSHPELHATSGEICAVIGLCLDDSKETRAHCQRVGMKGHCRVGPRNR
jgi:hypothetical protein